MVPTESGKNIYIYNLKTHETSYSYVLQNIHRTTACARTAAMMKITGTDVSNKKKKRQ